MSARPPLAVAVSAAVLWAGASAAPAGAAADPLTYRGGPVMHSAHVHPVFWAPSGTAFPSGYQSTIAGFLSAVASGGASRADVFATLAQYGDASGPATIVPTVAASIVDSQPYPAESCARLPALRCVTDADIQAEVHRIVAARGLPQGLADVYFVFTPPTVDVCGYAGVCASQGYCAYHSWIGTRATPTLYALVEYPSLVACQAPSQPNGSNADSAVNLTSHELSEAITDPLENAWLDQQGLEVGDKCLSTFSDSLGKTRYGAYDALIGSGVYELQDEWSNRHDGCVQGEAQFSEVPAAPVSRQLVRFDASSSAGPGGSASAVTWDFGDGSTGSGVSVAHRFPRTGTYRVRLAITSPDGTVRLTRVLTVAPSPPRISATRQSVAGVVSRGLVARISGEGRAVLRVRLRSRAGQSLSLAAHVDLAAAQSRSVRIQIPPRLRRSITRWSTVTATLTLSEPAATRGRTESASLRLALVG